MTRITPGSIETPCLFWCLFWCLFSSLCFCSAVTAGSRMGRSGGSPALVAPPPADSRERAETRILCLGDSNTFGLYYPAESNWCSRLEARWNETHADRIDTVMVAYPGNNSSRLLAAMPEIIGFVKPDLIFVLISVNDMLTVPWESWECTREKQRLQLLSHLPFRESEIEFQSTPGVDLRSLPDSFGGDVRGAVDYGVFYRNVPLPLGVRRDYELTWTRERTDADLTLIRAVARASGVETKFLTYVGAGIYQWANAIVRDTVPEAEIIDLAASLECPCFDFIVPDGHPNAAGYEAMAAELLDWLETKR